MSATHANAYPTFFPGWCGSDPVPLALTDTGSVFAGCRLFAPGSGLTEPSISPEFAVVKLSIVDGTPAWQANIPPPGGIDFWGVRDLTVDAAGDVVAVGGLGSPRLFDVSDFLIAKLANADGAVIWATALDDPPLSFGLAHSVAIAAEGDVFAAGRMGPRPGRDDMIISRLSGGDGSLLWLTRIHGTSPGKDAIALKVVLDAAGDPIVSGSVGNTDTSSDFAIVKLDAASGSILWQVEIDGSGQSEAALDLAVDSNGDVVGAGALRFATGFDGVTFAAVKLSGADGAEQWRNPIANTGVTNFAQARSVVFDSADDVILGGITTNEATGPDFTVVKLSGATGTEIWRYALDGGFPDPTATLNIPIDETIRLAVDGSDDVIAVGRIESAANAEPSVNSEAVVVKLSGVDGSESWARVMNGVPYGRSIESARGLIVTDAGDVVVSGELNRDSDDRRNPLRLADMFVTRLAGADGAETIAISGKKLLVRAGSDPNKRMVKVKSRDRKRIALPLPGTTEDPLISGATLELINPTTAEADLYALPAAGWRVMGKPPRRVRGYRYKDKSFGNGPCDSVRLKEGRFSARCRGQQIAFTLDEAAQGSLAVVFATGPDLVRYCMLFDAPRHDDGVKARFSASNAPFVHACRR